MSHESTSTLQVSLTWGEDRIGLRCLDKAGEVRIGEGSGVFADLPAPRFTFARRAGTEDRVFVPEGQVGTRVLSNGDVEVLEGPCSVALSPGDLLSLCLGDFTLTAALCAAEPVIVPKPRSASRGAFVHLGLAAMGHFVALGLSAQAAMARGMEDGDEDPAADLRSLVVSAEERTLARAPRKDDGPGGSAGAEVDQRAGDGRAGGGERAAGQAGKMGESDARSRAEARYAVTAQSKRDATRTMSRDEAMAEAASFGMIGLAKEDGVKARYPSIDWGRMEESLGGDALSARGAMWGDWQGEMDGYHGLELTGTGEGGGGKGEGIGLGTIGTLGHGQGLPGDGTGGGGLRGGHRFSWQGNAREGEGMGLGSGGRGHGTRRPPRTWGSWGGDWAYVSGRLPAESIRRLIHLQWGRIKLCYENGLRKNPSLQGRIVVNFVIGRDGSVSSVSDGGSTLSDREVVNCVLRVFYGFSFPPPEGGIVTVTYPLVLTPT
ncbi:MAG: AgmX/PglI C-terminal domain-containing protein [Byssovorax sp.]